MLEVFTIGGGEYIVNIFNAVAAWTGGGGFRSLLRVVMVMGLIYSLLVVAFSLNWRAWLNWFLGATLMYSALIVPTTTVKVTDRLNASLAPATVANVPIGLAIIASVSSTAGDWLTRTAETVFVMPSSLQLLNNGMIYGARLWDRTREFKIRDPRINANVQEYFKQCLFYDILLGHENFNTIANSNNILVDMGPGSPARGMKWIPATGTSTIITCQAGYGQLATGMDTYSEAAMEDEAEKIYPGLTPAAAKAKLVADLPVLANEFHGSSQTAKQVFQQRSLVGAFLEARANLSGSDGDTFAMLRAEEQARNTYTSIAQQAMTWVPLLNIVLTVVFYAMFPVIFPLFLIPRTGVSALKGYFTGFFYLAAWGPLYAVLHMFIMDRTADSLNATAPGGITMAGMAGIDAVNADTATIAGFLMMSIPFLAAGMARGAMAVSSQATSMLAPAQSAAEAAAVERTTGSYSYGNQSFQNLNGNNRQFDQWNTAPSFVGGHATSTFVNDNGTTTKTTASGATIYDTSGGQSRLAFGASLSQFANAERQETLSELETARTALTQERSRQVSLLNRTASRQTTGVRNVSGSESSSGSRFAENTQSYDNQGRGSSDSTSQSERITDFEANTQSNTDRLNTVTGGSAGVNAGGGGAGRGRGAGRRGGVGGNLGANASISGGRHRQDDVSRGSRKDQAQGFDSSTSVTHSNGSNVTRDSGTYSQSGSFSRSEGYSDSSFSRERALDEIQRIDNRIAEIDELSTSLNNSASTREGHGTNLSFDMSQIVASRYQEKAQELGLTAPSLSRTDYTPQEQSTYEVVARAIIDDYYDEKVEPYRDLIPEKGTVVGNVTGPGDFTEADLRGSGPSAPSGRRRSSGGGSSGDSGVADRISQGQSDLEDRYQTNSGNYARRRREFDDNRSGLGGTDDRFDERFYDRDQRKRNKLHRSLRGDKK